MEEEWESPFDHDTMSGIISMLMRIDARLEMLLALFTEEDDHEEEPDA